MLRTKREILLEITSQIGLSKMANVKILLIAVLMLTLFSMAWAQPFVVRSVGLGPSFEVYPAIVILGRNGTFKLTFLSSEKNVVYDILRDGKTIFSNNTNKKSLALKISLKNAWYSYLTVRAKSKSDPWNTSVATILVLSPKINVDVNKEISIWAVPKSFSLISPSTGSVFVIVNSAFGRKSLTISLDKTILIDRELSPVSNSPKIFEVPFSTKKLADGEHSLKAKMLLITGMKLTVAATIVVYIAPPVVQSFEVSPKVVKPQKVTFTASVVIKDEAGVKSVKINGVAADYRDGKWVALVPVDFSKVIVSEATNVNFTVKATNNFNKSAEKRFSRKISVRVIPPVPTNLHTTSVSYNSISIAWNASPGASDYKIYRSTNGQHFSRIAETSSTNYTDSSLNLSTTYYYKVKAINAYGESGYSNVVKATTLWIWWWLIGIFASIMVLLLFTIY